MPAVPSLPERFDLIIEWLLRTAAMAASKRRALAPLTLLLWPRIRRLQARLTTLMARLRAGELPPASRPASSQPAASQPAALRPESRQIRSGSRHHLPRGFAWLIRLMPETAAYGSQLQHWLTDPELPALLAADPRLGRILRPLCHMLAIRPGPELLPPPRPPPRQEQAACSAATASSAPPLDPRASAHPVAASPCALVGPAARRASV